MAENSFRVRVIDERNLPTVVGETGTVDLHLEHTDADGKWANVRMRVRVTKTDGSRSKAEFDGAILVSRGAFHERHPFGKFRLRRGDHPFFLRHQLHSQKVFMTI